MKDQLTYRLNAISAPVAVAVHAESAFGVLIPRAAFDWSCSG